jgi:hypothetical protein
VVELRTGWWLRNTRCPKMGLLRPPEAQILVGDWVDELYTDLTIPAVAKQEPIHVPTKV